MSSSGSLSTQKYPLLLSPEAAADTIATDEVLLIDLAKPEIYAQAHLTNAIPFAYSHLVSGQPPSPGRLPDLDTLGQTLGAHGIDQDRYVIAYDDEGGGKAARLCWTLHLLGHRNVSVIDGGIHGWMYSRLPVTQRPATPTPVNFVNGYDPSVFADSDFILDHLKRSDSDVQLLDARTPGEYAGTDVRAARGGHIPGAINNNWLDTVNKDEGFRLKNTNDLRQRLDDAGIRSDRDVVAYCQTHHRSSHAYVMLKSLGFERVRGYAGSWSEWGNSETWPIEV